jgi:hypothetical protein
MSLAGEIDDRTRKDPREFQRGNGIRYRDVATLLIGAQTAARITE